MLSSSNKSNIVRDFSDKRASYFQANYAAETPANYLRRLRRRLIVQAIGQSADGAVVMDAGCGPAVLYPEILEQCSRYTALDLTPANLEEIPRTTQSAKLECVAGDLDSFDWPRDVYDILICSGAAEYINNPSRVLRSMAASVKTGGLLVCSFPNVWSPYRLWSEYAYTPLSQTWRRWRGTAVANYSRKLFAASTVRRWLVDGVRRVEVRYFGYNFIPQPLDALLSNLDYAIAARLQRMSPSVLRVFCSEFLVVVRC
jgi:SAM-dependent methyltransferase